MSLLLWKPDRIILISHVVQNYRYKICVTIRLHVKSEGISNTLVTMETDRQQFYKKCPILKVYQLPWLPLNKDSFNFVIFGEYSLRPFI